MSRILVDLKLKFTNRSITFKFHINKNNQKKNNDNLANIEDPLDFMLIGKLCSRATTYLNFSPFGPLVGEILDFKANGIGDSSIIRSNPNKYANQPTSSCIGLKVYFFNERIFLSRTHTGSILTELSLTVLNIEL
ncbi:hypothetical protein BCR32DRAFT_277210 [Anaeromyces robustus]|uniref:Uncharacterized protein n=1 Tax=Anaeromyces robustus TaxID=1754192 RepID=A0A1Y1XEY5_9FUNG|nr:hypothetical protein BCR32DRAFT_277210 [Anaeromyces robustus]|eukprot:ORX84318.1 hypothetical protein BCR32DRAFT_277210 [Anaeromyces robustus]